MVGGLVLFVVAWIGWSFYAYSHRLRRHLEFQIQRGYGTPRSRRSTRGLESVTLVDELPRILRRRRVSSGACFAATYARSVGRRQAVHQPNIPPYLVVRARDTFVVVNFEDPARTRELYGQLTARVTR